MLAAARLKKGTAQSFRLANSVRVFVGLSWYLQHKMACVPCQAQAKV